MLIGMKYSAPKAIVISLHFPKSRFPYIGTHFHVECYEGDGPWKHLLQPAECWCSKLLTGKKCTTTARHRGMPRTFEVPMSVMGIHNRKRILNRGIFIFVPNRIYFINNREFLLTRRTCVYFDTTANTFPKKKNTCTMVGTKCSHLCTIKTSYSVEIKSLKETKRKNQIPFEMNITFAPL
ncbi:hypothetical protein, conserved [Trypanosoma brucei brucei TREU927]|uniref:Uncharacterized protein n=1 Tax=Trypanosoma brucei brucei (strain 927/4 GUTat10.1) TaxID=185431 RepID=Q585R6_TRYB2|nr:hypothetical protein, conserved [Trypanosoma brucei brucei TREU927]AAQ15605.1 hypothetical protein, conserved [Trypanosoma brucei brucei TREU927]AAX79544.1 hypothetical protein, conserved [Trypanosoma brucei]